MSSSTPTPVASVTTASVIAKPTGLCPESNGISYRTSCGAEYVIECGIDRAGGDMPGVVYTNDLATCMAQCDSTQGCSTVSWVQGSPGPCYLKSSAGTPNNNPSVHGAKQLKGCTSVTPATPSGVADAPKAVSSSASNPAPSASSPTVSCGDYADGSTITTGGSTFTVECFMDRTGNDVGMIYAESLGACVASCASTGGCVSVAWVPGSPTGPCYMKGAVGPAFPNGNVHGAKLIS